ncbi:hypothetical protein EHM76_07070, partial [bacterium]
MASTDLTSMFAAHHSTPVVRYARRVRYADLPASPIMPTRTFQSVVEFGAFWDWVAARDHE